MVTFPLLERPNFSLPFEIHTDASQLAVDACLIQKYDGKPHPVSYFSHKLRSAEIRYSATELGALPIIEAIKAFHPYIYGRKFHVYTDHKPLVYIFKGITK